MAEIFRMTGRAGLMGLVCAMALAGCGDDSSSRADSGCTGICLDDGGTDSATMTDAGPDTGVIVIDSGTDTGMPPSCAGVGGACDPARGCSTGGCLAENSTSIGDATDPIDMGPGGAISIPAIFWLGGYCSPNISETGGLTASCDVNNADDPLCGDCATCVNVGGTPPAGLCLAKCTTSITDNGGCRTGYDCNLSIEACFPGCGGDDECKVNRQDTNGIAGIQTPTDCTGDSARAAADQLCGGTDSNFDHLVYDAASASICDTHTFRCTNPGTAGAQGGDTCTDDTQCEAEGRCLDEASFDWPGGYCTKFRCDLAGNSCAGDAVCQDRRIGVSLCLGGCTVADGATMADQAAWLTNRGGCRDGYSCTWNGVGGAGTANNGACVPGNFNAVAANNIGGPCTADADCWSPFGQGLCLTPADDGSGFRNGYCTVLDCLAPGMPTNTCGTNGSCIDLDGSSGDITGCLLNCTTATDCRPQYACADADGDPSTAGGLCVPSCSASTECRSTETCSIPAGDTVGDCVPM